MFAILGMAGILFASGRVRLDVVALGVVLALMLTGVATPRQALAGFGDPVVLLVAGLLVVGEMLNRTGVAFATGRWLMRVGGSSETRMLVLLMGVAAGLGSVMSSTAVTAVFIPVVLTVTARTSLDASRLLMPLSFAALVSGMLTLIATTPNLVVSAELGSRGMEPFNFFSFTPIGLAVLVVTILYMWLLGRHLLPGGEPAPPKSTDRTLDDLWNGFGLADQGHALRVPPGADAVGKSLSDIELGSRYRARVIGIERLGRLGRRDMLPSPGPDAEIHAGDVLVVVARPDDAEALAAGERLELVPAGPDVARLKRALGLAVVLVHPESQLVGRALRETSFRSAHGLHVLGLRRRDEIVSDFVDEPLDSGDSLLVAGAWDAIARLQGETHDFVVLTLPLELDEVAPAARRAPAALAILAGMVVLSATEVVPVVAAVLIAALAAVFTRCLSMEDGYRAIHWSSVVLIAGMLPLADALERSGGVDLLVGKLVTGLEDVGPRLVLSALFFVTAGMGLVLSNTATAVLMAPIAVRAAEVLGVSPYPMAMTVAIAASAAFVTPVSTPVVTLVVTPGGYRFLDFVKVGVPLLLLTWATTLLVTPLVFPF
ncbi:MAG: SLC13 family permease [Myxococcota bacterium]|nr:SLC13 family permease [Myxococcota bacterium]